MKSLQTKKTKNKTIKNITENKVKKHLPEYFYKLLIENENFYYKFPYKKNLDYVLYLYKKAIEFYTLTNPEYTNYFMSKMTEFLSNHNKVVAKYVISKIEKRIKEFTEKNKENIKKTIVKDCKAIINTAKHNIIYGNKYIDLSLFHQHESFINKKKEKLLKEFVKKKKTALDDSAVKLAYKSPMEKEKNFHIKEYHWSTTKTLKQINPKKLFFDETEEFIKKDLENIKKRRQFDINNYTNELNKKILNQITDISMDYLGEIIDLFSNEYKEKIAKYKEYNDNLLEYKNALDSIDMMELVNSVKKEFETEILNLSEETNLNYNLISSRYSNFFNNANNKEDEINLLLNEFMEKILDQFFQKKQISTSNNDSNNIKNENSVNEE
jgi:acyl carrier protein